VPEMAPRVAARKPSRFQFGTAYRSFDGGLWTVAPYPQPLYVAREVEATIHKEAYICAPTEASAKDGVSPGLGHGSSATRVIMRCDSS